MMFLRDWLSGGFGFAGLFFLGLGVGLISSVICIFIGYLLAPPDIINYTRIACICQALFSSIFKYFQVFFIKRTEAFLPRFYFYLAISFSSAILPS